MRYQPASRRRTKEKTWPEDVVVGEDSLPVEQCADGKSSGCVDYKCLA